MTDTRSGRESKMQRSLALPLRGAQSGFTLLEMLIAALISVIAVTGMLVLMASTLGSAKQTIELGRLTQELRTGMQVMSRDLRRANYHNNFLSCYGNAACLTTLGYTAKISDINITNQTGPNGASDCFWFWYDRPQYCNGASCTQAQMAALQTPVTADAVAGFRRVVNADDVGVLQMTTSLVGAPTCADDYTDSDWSDITDTDFMDVLTFDVDDTQSVCENLSTGTSSQVVERIRLTITARMRFDASVAPWLQSQAGVTRTLTDFIRVRNNVTKGAACT
jgi:prepilin-type N-terminal cleavage/methylation domain-containing protein